MVTSRNLFRRAACIVGEAVSARRGSSLGSSAEAVGKGQGSASEAVREGVTPPKFGFINKEIHIQ